MGNVIALVFGVLMLWAGYRLYTIDFNERAMDRHKEDLRQGQIEHAQWKARMRRERLERLYDVTELELDRIEGRIPERTHYPQDGPALPRPPLNPECDRIKKLGLTDW